MAMPATHMEWTVDTIINPDARTIARWRGHEEPREILSGTNGARA